MPYTHLNKETFFSSYYKHKTIWSVHVWYFTDPRYNGCTG